tara:strand:+ start:2646 stop:3047 length:402 start_codon:yes stop_codon:yes gene_type:complete
MKLTLWILGIVFGLPLFVILFANGRGALNRVERSAPPPVPFEQAETTFVAGSTAMKAGQLELAEDLFLSIPEDHPLYAKAQRFVGWEIHGRRNKASAAGVSFVNEAILADPLDGNVWQDAWRTYKGTLPGIGD